MTLVHALWLAGAIVYVAGCCALLGWELAFARLAHITRPSSHRVSWWGLRWWQSDAVRALAIWTLVSIVVLIVVVVAIAGKFPT